MAMAFLLPVRCLLMIEALNANQSKVSFSKRLRSVSYTHLHVFKGTCSAFWLYNIPWEKVEGEPYPRKVVYNEIDVVELQQVPKDLHIMSCNYHIMVLKDDCVSKDFIRPDEMCISDRYYSPFAV